MVWNVTTSDDVGWSFKKVVILVQKNKVVLLLARLFDLGLKLTFKYNL